MTSSRIVPARRMYNAMDVTPALSTEAKWIVMVHILERHSEWETGPNSQYPGTKYRNFIVTDMVSTKIGCVTYDKILRSTNTLLIPYKRYRISNARIKRIEEYYQISEYMYSWTLNNSTIIEPVEDHVPHPFPYTFKLTPFADFSAHLNHTVPINIRAFVVHSLPIVDISSTGCTKDLVVIDEEKKPLMLRIWDDLQEDCNVRVTDKFNGPTIILAFNIKVTIHYGMYLSTRKNTYIMQNPPLQEGRALKDWYKNHEEEIRQSIGQQVYKDMNILLPPPSPSEKMSLSVAVQTFEHERVAWIKGNICLSPGQQFLTYIAYAKCNKSLHADEGLDIICSNCGQKTILEARCKMEVIIK